MLFFEGYQQLYEEIQNCLDITHSIKKEGNDNEEEEEEEKDDE